MSTDCSKKKKKLLKTELNNFDLGQDSGYDTERL